MRAKYKLGCLIQHQEGMGVVDGILTTTEGYQYRTKEGKMIPEAGVLEAFRPVKRRMEKKPAKRPVDKRILTEKKEVKSE